MEKLPNFILWFMVAITLVIGVPLAFLGVFAGWVVGIDLLGEDKPIPQRET